MLIQKKIVCMKNINLFDSSDSFLHSTLNRIDGKFENIFKSSHYFPSVRAVILMTPEFLSDILVNHRVDMFRSSTYFSDYRAISNR